MTKERSYFSGDSIAQAINQASRHFGVEPASLRYKVLDKRHGFLKLRRRVVITVDPQNPRVEEAEPLERVDPTAASEAPPAPSQDEARVDDAAETLEFTPPRFDSGTSPEPGEEVDESDAVGGRVGARAVESSEPESDSEPESEPVHERSTADFPEAPPRATERFEEARGEEADAAREALRRILDVSSLSIDSAVLQGEEQLEIELWGDDQEILLRDRGRLLLAIQHLLPRAVRGLLGRSVACRVDSDNFHEIRAERLRDLAQRAANDVRRRGRPKTLEPMSPDERRIVHLTLTDDPAVDTQSHGDGLFKRVTVSPTRGRQPRGFDPYSR